MDDNLGDQILKEYMKCTSKSDILKKLNINDSIYDSWIKINRNELKKIDTYIEKQNIKLKLKIRNLPELNIESESETDSDVENNLYKEPTIDKAVLIRRKTDIHKKINKLTELLNEGRLNQSEFDKAKTLLQDEINHINKKLLER